MSDSKKETSYDVVVVGAGVAGSACARFLAEGGRRVALIDRRPIDRVGARWVNGVPREAFRAARLAPPVPPELRGEGHAFVLASPSGRSRVTLADDNPVLEVDMRHLGARLREGATKAGATILEETEVTGIELSRGRPRALHTPRGTLVAPLFVDASGLPAVVRRAVFPGWPDIPEEHICLAAQEVRDLVDDEAAAAWLAANGVSEGDVFARAGTQGGYSVLNVRVERESREVALLAGAVPAAGTNGARMIDAFCAEQKWIGRRIFGGASALPLRRPYARLVAPGLALLGDTACQMFSAHGSGIAIGLRAARLLADVVLAAPANRPGDEEVLFAYASRFHRRHGGTLASYDVIRRATQRFSEAESEEIFTSGLMSVETMRPAMLQRLPVPSPQLLRNVARGAVRAPRLAGKIGAAFARVPLLLAHAQLYPRRPDLEALEAWEKRMATLVGEAADPVG